MTDTPKSPTTPALLADISNRLAVIEARLEIISDHESRIRELERARWQSAWLTSILSSALASGIVALIIKTFI
jgi:hypothetical protein